MGLLDEALGGGEAPAPTGAPAPTAQQAGVDVGRVQGDPAFQRLSPASQQRVLGALGAKRPETPNLLGGMSAEQAPSTHPGPPPDVPIDSAIPGELKRSLVDPTYRLMTGRSTGVLGTAGDAISTTQLLGAGAAFIASGPLGAGSVLLAPTVGATVRGLLTDFNASAGWTSFLGGLAEVGVGGVQALSGWRNAMSTARGLIAEGAAGGAAGEGAASVTASQRMGSAIINRANEAFATRAKPISRAIDGLEKTAATMTVTNEHPAFQDVAYLVDKAKEMRVTAPELTKLESDVAKGMVNIKDVVSLRKELENGLNYAKSAADPNMPANAKLARQVRSYATDAITSALGPEAGTRYGESLLAWKTQVRDPQRILRAVLSKNLEPSTAFELMYGGPRQSATPEVMQTLSSLRDVDPTFRQTLRLGAMQHFFAASNGDLRQSVAGSKAFNTLGPMLGTTGLFSDEEMHALKLFMRPGLIDTAMATLGQTVSGRSSRVLHLGLSAAGAGTSGSAVYHLMANHPQLGFLGIAASGGLPLLRRVLLAPPGSPAAQSAALGIARGMTNMGAGLANRPSVDLDD